MTEIVGLLHTDHENLQKLLDAFERQLDLFDAGETPNHEVLQGVLDYCLTYPGIYHEPAEDFILRRLRLRDEAWTELAERLLAEHVELAARTREVTVALNRVPEEGGPLPETFGVMARDFLDAYRRHIEIEERDFLPAALRSLTEEDWRKIELEAPTGEDPLFGEQSRQRFEALRHDILAWDRLDRDG